MKKFVDAETEKIYIGESISLCKLLDRTLLSIKTNGKIKIIVETKRFIE